MFSSQQRAISYVLVTAARDEAENIERTIRSVLNQTLRPTRWVIVSDGSTDGTNDVVSEYAAKHGWIELIRRPRRNGRHFAGKADSTRIGYTHIKELNFDFIGFIDADISFEIDFFSYLLNKFTENPNLGIAGAPFQEGNASYDFRFSSIEHVSGACQLFRRKCYEDIGGYFPVISGGIDVIAVLKTRMLGWQTRTFTERSYQHHRKMGTALDSVLKSRYKDGKKDYSLGAHPAWEIFRSIYQMTKKPFFMGGFLLFCGYFFSMIRRSKRPISTELMKFRRSDQLSRLKLFIKSLLT